MDDIITNADIRHEKAACRLGGKDKLCIHCGEDDVRCLELHHLAGQKYHDDVVPLCRNCHRKISDMQLDHPDDLEAAIPLMFSIGRYLMGVADFILMIAYRLKEFGEQLIAWAQGYELVPLQETAQ